MIHARNFAARVPHARMIAVSDAVEENARAAAQELGVSTWYTDYRRALEDKNTDAVIVVTPTKYHHDIVLEAAAAGRHIFCEKPMAMDPKQCEAMIRAARENSVKLQIGFMRRFDGGFRRAREIIDSGAIGDVVLIKSLTRGPSAPQEWMFDIRKSNGPLAEVNSHDIDTIRWFSGSDAVSLHAIAGNFRCRQIAAQYPDFYDTVLMNLQMGNGCLCNVEGAQGVGYGYDARVDILGTEGCIQVGDLRGNSTVTYSRGSGMRGDVVSSWRNLFSEAYVNEDISFIECIRNDTEPEVNGTDGLMAVRIVLAGNESIRTGKIVSLKEEEE